jgi:CheY-like chemotaxis protein
VRSAIELAASHEFDVLISDLGLPDGEAKEVLQEVAGRYGAVGIALSGYGMDHDIRSSKESGFSHHLVKPVQVSRLDALLREISANMVEDA